ncbi:MAG: PilZ domain-containing protein [Planctomycetota bacterium]|jgi:hypothetical protein
MQTPTLPATALLALMRREIDRFIFAARERSEVDIDTRRRALRRYHRSWPLLVSSPRLNGEVSAALHSASTNGIGFLCNHEYRVGQLLLIKLFWYEEAGLRVPGIVRHATPYRHEILVGCEFAVDDETACQAALQSRRWHG